MKILVLQHVREEHPGIFRKFLKEDGHEWVPFHLQEETTLPKIENLSCWYAPRANWEPAEIR